MEDRKIDVTKPFIAIRQDVEGDDFARTMGEYLCNPLDEDLLDVEVSLGGWFSDETYGVVHSNESRKDVFTVPAGHAVRFTLSTWDEYTEFVCHWTVRFRTATKPLSQSSFGTFKSLADCVTLEETPCLGGRAMVVPR